MDLLSYVYIIYFGFGCDICIRVTSVRIIIITHRDRALFDLNVLVSSLGEIVPLAYGLGHYSLLGLHSGVKSNSALLLCVIIIL